MSIQTKPHAAIHFRYCLKPSRLALVFQGSSILIIFVVLYQFLNLIALCILLLLALASFFFFQQQDRIAVLVQLDEQDWVVQYRRSKRKRRVQFKKIIDHHFYIAIYFQQQSNQPMLVWRDELPIKSWKSLKSRAKLN